MSQNKPFYTSDPPTSCSVSPIISIGVQEVAPTGLHTFQSALACRLELDFLEF
jgi:hypothetical protein